MLPGVVEQGAGAEGDAEASSLAQEVVCSQCKWGTGKAVVEGGC